MVKPNDWLRIAGTAGDDVLAGTNGSDTLDGGAGDDTMAGGLGDDDYHVDAGGDVIEETAGGGTDTVHATASRYTLSAHVEALTYAGTGSFTGIGNAQDNILASGDGNDRLDGGSGNDRLAAGAGDDTMNGGAGDDGITAMAGNDVFDGGTGVDTVYSMGARDSYTIRRAGADGLVFTSMAPGGGTHTLTVQNVEYFGMAGKFYSLAEFLAALPADGSDSIGGSGGSDRLDGFDGTDTLAGGNGDDTYVVRNAGTTVVELAGGGVDTAEVAYAGKAWQLADFVENGRAVDGRLAVSIDGNALNNTLTGNAGANVLFGGAGNDTLDGGKGSDVLAGGSGNDSYYVDATGDTVTEQAGEGIDTVFTTLARITLGAHVENVAYLGSAAFTAIGNDRDNVFTGGGADNTIDGGAGTDTFVAGGAFADYTCERPNATDIVLVAGAQKITLKNTEQVRFSDGLKTIADIFHNIASSANDTLAGTDRNDTLDGLGGADRMTGLKGDDTYVVDNVADATIELAGEGIDTVNVAIKSKGSTYTLGANVEHATITSTAAVNVAGNAGDNRLTGNNAANTLSGGDGNDILVGGKGSDLLDGGAGNDFYGVDTSGDRIVEGAHGGHDVVETTATKYTLAANVEELRFVGKGAFTGVGNEQDNVIAGAAGNDKLTGGGGSDTFVIGTGSDTIQDFASGSDQLVIGLPVGDGNGVIDGAIMHHKTGGFSAGAELVIFTQEAASVTTAGAAKAIGSAAAAYGQGDTALFVLHGATATAVFLFTSGGEDALVSKGELTQIATLTGVATTGIDDYALGILS